MAVRLSVTSTTLFPVTGSMAAKSGCTASLVFVIDPRRSPRACSERDARVREQLLAAFVQAHLGPGRIGRAVVNVEYILHRLNERRVLLGRDAEALYKPRLDLVFFRPRRIVLALTESKIFSSTSLLASNESVHLARLGGGGLHAIRTRCTNPVSRGACEPRMIRAWTRSTVQREVVCSSAGRSGGTVRKPTSLSSSIGARRARVAAQYFGASSR